MDILMNQELGFLGTNVDDNWNVADVYTELVEKAENGDKTALYKLNQIVRHYDGVDADVIVPFVRDAIARIEA